jgi:hypothetical protein
MAQRRTVPMTLIIKWHSIFNLAFLFDEQAENDFANVKASRHITWTKTLARPLQLTGYYPCASAEACQEGEPQELPPSHPV